MSRRVFLTGAFDNVGEYTLLALLRKGYTVTAFDIRNKSTEKKQARLASKQRFETIWGDLRNAIEVQQAVSATRPEAILHIAAVIAPMAYVAPKLAREVNVDGTRNLIEAARAARVERFIFTSSYSVHGSRNPHRTLPPIGNDTEVDPVDNYGRHKVIGEQMIRESGLPYAIYRLPAVSALDAEWGQHPAFLRFGMMIPLDQKRTGGDVRDVALAFANGVEANIIGRNIIISGDARWRTTGREQFRQIFASRNLPMPPEELFRQADPAVDAAWYCEDHTDSQESQRLLQYQEHCPEQYLEAVAKNMGPMRLLMPFLAGVVTGQMKKQSLFYGKPGPADTRSIWEVVCEGFQLDPATE